MNERQSFLASLAASPHDDGLYLIFADWLDERQDPLGELIRLELELEPLLFKKRSDLDKEMERRPGSSL